MADTYAAVPTTVGDDRHLNWARALAAAVAGVVLLDVAVVRAPGLALLAVPFLLGAFAMRRGRTPASVALSLSALGYVAIGVNFLAQNGLDAGWADLVFAIVGTPVALALAVVLAVRMSHRRSGTR